MALWVARSLKLDMRLRIGYVNSGGKKHVPAWITLPPPWALYGTPAFSEWIAILHIQRNFLAEASFEAIVFALAHEMSHLVLTSTKHPLHDKEELVDLAAMFFGYAPTFVKGAVYEPMNQSGSTRYDFSQGAYMVRTVVHQIGYLQKEEYEFAARFITRLAGPPR
ncbi:MAG: hypothetical protein JWN89_55 [Parcubacteria group bacterium]|nr:hypothetical protein [Parcubacteria group bacterium]